MSKIALDALTVPMGARKTGSVVASSGNAAASSASAASAVGSTHLIGGEPDFSDICTNDSDRMILRNIVYTIWAMNRNGGGEIHDASVNSYMVN